jgi:DNA-binding transcriptional ArsR family regulator
MDERREPHEGGWDVGQSAVQEVGLALTVIGNEGTISSLSEEMAALIHSVPPDWLAQWPELLGGAHHGGAVLETLADLAGVLLEPDYSRATLAMRALTLDTALHRVQARAAPYGVTADPTLTPGEQLPDLLTRVTEAIYRDAAMVPQADMLRRLNRAFAWLPHLLRDDERHLRFWHWLDRFYYECYRPWRAARAPIATALEQQAATALGGLHGSTPPDLTWLAAQHPLRSLPALGALVQRGRIRVFFWAEPFGLADSWGVGPGLLTVSFADPTGPFAQFRAHAADLATRAAALGDPTRLSILRLIRYFGMVNTEIADYLGLARPTVSIHAKILREAGLIRSHQEGRLVRHALVPGSVRQVFRDLERFLDLPDEEEQDEV